MITTWSSTEVLSCLIPVEGRGLLRIWLDSDIRGEASPTKAAGWANGKHRKWEEFCMNPIVMSAE